MLGLCQFRLLQPKTLPEQVRTQSVIMAELLASTEWEGLKPERDAWMWNASGISENVSSLNFCAAGTPLFFRGQRLPLRLEQN